MSIRESRKYRIIDICYLITTIIATSNLFSAIYNIGKIIGQITGKM